MAFDPAAQFRRSGQRDERRRRLLVDEGLASDDRPGGRPSRRGPGVCHKSEHYGDAEFLDNARRLLDLIPRGPVVWLLLLLGGVTLIVALEAAYASMPDWAGPGQSITAFDLAAEGSLGGWISSLWLLAASATALLIYSIRRHRTDDYRGRYRVWMAAAGCWFLLATDEAASLHEAFQTMIVAASGTTIVGDGAVWWIMVYAVLLGAVGVRLVIDMRESRLALTAFIACAAAVLADVVMRLGLIAFQSAQHAVMALEGVELSAYLLLLVSMGLYARHVLLDAEGRLPRRESKAKSPPVDKTDQSADNAEEQPANVPVVSPPRTFTPARPADPPQPVPQPTFARAAPAPAAAVAKPAGNRPLSKAERKALKKRLLQERANREKQQAKWK